MVKRMRPASTPTETGSTPQDGGGARKRLKRLEREVAELGVTEAKRLEQLKDVRARAAAVRATLAALRAKDPGAPRTPGSDASPAGPTGYCMRERRRVTISDPKSVTLSNGRTGIAGTCSTCGVRVTVFAARPAPTGG
jgi:Domain of unknown function (DUF5679)